MSENIWEFTSSELFSDISRRENQDLLYSCYEIEKHSKNIDWFEDKVLKKFLSQELLNIWNNLDGNDEKNHFNEIVNKYENKLKWKYNYNIIWSRILLELNNKWLEKSFIQKTRDIKQETNCDIIDFKSSISDTWSKITNSTWDYIESSFNDLDALAKNIREANNKDRSKLIIDTISQAAYESMEPSKKLKFLWLFLPKWFINFIEDSVWVFIVNWKKITTDTFIDDILEYIENMQWIIDFFEVDTQKYARLDVKNLDFTVQS